MKNNNINELRMQRKTTSKCKLSRYTNKGFLKLTSLIKFQIFFTAHSCNREKIDDVCK